MLGKQRRRAARTKIRDMSTKIAGSCETQTIPSKGLRNTTFVYPPGTRRTGKPEPYKA